MENDNHPCFGKKYEDTISGFKGTCVARLEFLDGTISLCLQPKCGKDGKFPESKYINADQLKLKA